MWVGRKKAEGSIQWLQSTRQSEARQGHGEAMRPGTRLRIHRSLSHEPIWGVTQAVGSKKPGVMAMLITDFPNDVWWVEHDDGSRAYYHRSDFSVCHVDFCSCSEFGRHD